VLSRIRIVFSRADSGDGNPALSGIRAEISASRLPAGGDSVQAGPLEGEIMMKKILFCFLICVIPSMVFASSFPQSIAFEFQEHGKFTGIIGKAYITETAVEIVTFAEKDGMVVPFAFIDALLEKRSQIEGLYSIKCRNQLGVVSTGTLDIRDPLKPKITLTSDKGVTATNISEGGRKMKKKFLPKVDLGK
jgi:hypothetical protein